MLSPSLSVVISSFFCYKFHLLQQLLDSFLTRVVHNFVDNRYAQLVEFFDLDSLAAKAFVKQLV